MKRKWIDIQRSDLMEMSKTMSGTDIAKQFGVHHNAVYYRMRMFGLTQSRKSRQFNPPKDELARLYKSLSMAKLAEHYGVGETIVFSRVRDYGIKRISRSERLSGIPKTLEHRLAMSKSALESGIRAGKKNGNWKGGKSSAGKLARSKAAYHEWKAAVLANAKWQCQGCLKAHGALCEHCGHRILLHAHHILPFSSHPDKRYYPFNGKALCDRCHMTEHHTKIG